MQWIRFAAVVGALGLAAVSACSSDDAAVPTSASPDSGVAETAIPGCARSPEGSRTAALAERCVVSDNPHPSSCQQDSDCPNGPCGCSVQTEHQNIVCLTNSNCKVDADCGSGERCVLSHPTMLGYPDAGQPIVDGNEIAPSSPNQSFSEALGYFCTTPQDTCCPAGVGGNGKCVYDWDHKHWGWGYAP